LEAIVIGHRSTWSHGLAPFCGRMVASHVLSTKRRTAGVVCDRVPDLRRRDGGAASRPGTATGDGTGRARSASSSRTQKKTSPETIRVTREWEEAVRRGAVDALQRLLDAGADIDARDSHGQTALMIAAVEGRRQTVEWLVAHRASLDRTAKYGLSALMLAVVNGHADIVRALTDAGASLDLRGTGAHGFAGKTALDLALARNDGPVVETLRSRGAWPQR
jgi:ankyrin repeat protein